MDFQRKLIVLSHLDIVFPFEQNSNAPFIDSQHKEMIDSFLGTSFEPSFTIILLTDYWQTHEELLQAVCKGSGQSKEELTNKRIFNSILFKISCASDNEKPIVTYVCSFGSINIADSDTLSVLFKFINEKFPSEGSALLTWDHGYAFGIFNNAPNNSSRIDRRTAGVPQFKQLLLAKGNNIEFIIKNAGFDTKITDFVFQNESNSFIEKSEINRVDMLTSSELAVALRRGFEDEKLDLIIFMNCNMMILDELYALGERTYYLVGAESPISWIGYNYQNLIQQLSSIESHEELESVVQSIFQSFEEKYKQHPDDLKWHVLSGFSLARMGEVRNALNEVTLLLIKHLNRVYPIINEYLNPHVEVGYYKDRDISNLISFDKEKPEHYNLRLYDCIDLFSFICKKSKRRLPKKAFQELAESITKFKYSVIVRRKGFFSAFKGKARHNLIESFSGISIYFPIDLNYIKASSFYDFFYNPLGNFTSFLSEDSLWNEFVLLYAKYHTLLQRNMMKNQ